MALTSHKIEAPTIPERVESSPAAPKVKSFSEKLGEEHGSDIAFNWARKDKVPAVWYYRQLGEHNYETTKRLHPDLELDKEDYIKGFYQGWQDTVERHRMANQPAY